MVDQHRLLLAPVGPALSTDLAHYTSADGSGKRRALESFPRLTTPGAGYIGHFYDLAYSIFASPTSDKRRR